VDSEAKAVMEEEPFEDLDTDNSDSEIASENLMAMRLLSPDDPSTPTRKEKDKYSDNAVTKKKSFHFLRSSDPEQTSSLGKSPPVKLLSKKKSFSFFKRSSTAAAAAEIDSFKDRITLPVLVPQPPPAAVPTAPAIFDFKKPDGPPPTRPPRSATLDACDLEDISHLNTRLVLAPQLVAGAAPPSHDGEVSLSAARSGLIGEEGRFLGEIEKVRPIYQRRWTVEKAHAGGGKQGARGMMIRDVWTGEVEMVEDI